MKAIFNERNENNMLENDFNIYDLGKIASENENKSTRKDGSDNIYDLGKIAVNNKE